MAPLRVVHLITGLAAGGAETMLYKLLSRVDSRRFHSSVVSLLPIETLHLAAAIQALDIDVYSARMQAGWRALPKAPELLSILSAKRPDLIMGWEVHGNVYAQFAGEMLGKKVIWNIRGSLDHITSEKPLTRMLIRLLALCSSRPSRIVYNSRNSAAQHEAFGYNRRKTVIIPNGFDCELFHPNKVAAQSVREDWRIPQGRPLVGMIARYHPVKDHRTFLNACALVNREIPISILLAGRGVDASNRELTAMIDHLGLTDDVLLLGERFDLPRITASLDLAVLSSVAEGFPNVIGEAMSCGVPCVATNVGDAAFILNGAGKIVPPSDSGALSLAMLDILRLPHAQSSELGARGRERIQADFSLPSVARRFESLCMETTAKPPRHSNALRIPVSRKD